jgi:hypothetical protein
VDDGDRAAHQGDVEAFPRARLARHGDRGRQEPVDRADAAFGRGGRRRYWRRPGN